MMRRKGHSGFSLLELSVVLSILAVIAVMGVDIGQNALRNSALLGTKERLALIQQALDAYAARNGYLPCPANPALLPSSASYGFESRNAVAGVGCLSSGSDVAQVSSVWFGMVPVRNLGLDDSFATDSWGGKLLYAVSTPHSGLVPQGLNSYAASTGTISIYSGTRTGTNYPLTTTNGVPGAGATYVVISHGRNQRGAYPTLGTAVAFACGADATLIEVENCDRSNATFYDSTYNEGKQAATQFDDILVWGTNQTTRNPIAVLTNSCPSGCATWCAPCEAARTSTPPGTPTRVCAKFITRNTPSCEAVCIWPNDSTPCP